MTTFVTISSFHPEDGDNTLTQNVGTWVPQVTTTKKYELPTDTVPPDRPDDRCFQSRVIGVTLFRLRCETIDLLCCTFLSDFFKIQFRRNS
jgi:hypothetical protein